MASSVSGSGGQYMLDFVKACPICSQHKLFHQAPTGSFQSIPRRPWSHVSKNVITGLHCSGRNTVVLTIIDHFSKMAEFILLQKEMAQLLVQDVLWLHGLPFHMVSDRVLQVVRGLLPACCGASIHSPTARMRKNKDLEVALQCMVSLDPAWRGWSTPTTL